MLVREIVKATNGRLVSGDPCADIAPEKISTDSRTIRRGEFFIALKGSDFDGGEFIEEVFRKGAIGALLMGQGAGNGQGKIIIQARDTTKALQDIARYHRMKFKIPVIALTGSNGKTTVKDMISSVLSAKYNVLKNEGTKNNHIGVPQTLLKLGERHDICVLELGTNHKGEIRMLADIARPTMCVITNIGPSHLEFLKCLKGVYQEKIQILRSLDKKKGIAVINGDDKFLSQIKGKGIVRFGFGESNDFRGKALLMKNGRVDFLLNGKERMSLRLLGIHNVYNALAAIAVSRRFGLSYGMIRKGLLAFRPAGMRLDLKRINGVDIINDAYNSNPVSMKRALEVIQYYPAKNKWVVSADMLELGRDRVYFHQIVGALIAASGIKGLLTFGELSKHTLSRALECGMNKKNLWHCSTKNEIADILKRVARKGDVVLLKGSRAMKMEEVLNKLKA